MNFPTSPMRQHDRLIEALCQDWRETGIVTLEVEHTPRAQRVLSISRKIRKEGETQGHGDCAARTVAGAPSGLSPVSRSQAKPLIDYRKEGGK